MQGWTVARAGLALLLLTAVPAGAAEPVAPQRIDGARVIDKAGNVYLLAGVRLVTEAEDEETFRELQDYLASLHGAAPLRFDDSAFLAAGPAVNRYGERLGLFFGADDRSLQEVLILRGYGVWNGLAGFPPELHARLVAAERLARKEKAGLWRTRRLIDANNPPAERWRGQFVIARGIVREVARTPARTYLNFGTDWKSDFTVAIPAAARRKFEAGEWTLSDLRDKSIMIRGPVRFYNGPYMEVDFPEQLEIEEAALHE